MTAVTFAHLPLPGRAGERLRLGSLYGSAVAVTAAGYCRQHGSLVVVLVQDTPTALKLERELQSLLPQGEWPVLLFPDWETLPYDSFSPHQDIISQRLSTLYQLPMLKQGMLILPLNTALLKTVNTRFLQQQALLVKSGDRLDMHQMRQRLEQAGYQAVDQVLEHGEFSARGSLLDLFPMGSRSPYRIDFFDDEIDSIRLFDPDTQRSTEQIDAIRLLPAHEFPTDEAAIEGFRSRFREQFTISREPESIYQQVSKGIWPAGIEYYLPLFFEQTHSLFELLPQQSLLLTQGDLETAFDQYWRDTERRYQDRRYDPARPLLEPAQLYLRKEELFGQLKRFARVDLHPEPLADSNDVANLDCGKLPEIAVNHHKSQPLAALSGYLEDHDDRCLFVVESDGRREALLELLQKIRLTPQPVSHWQQFAHSDLNHGIWVSPLEHSFRLPGAGISVICEAELFGLRVVQQRRRDQQKGVSSDTLIRSLAELRIGQPVVHLDHGVGRYRGLQTLTSGDMVTEFVTIEYAGGDKLYVPVSSLHLLSRYSGGAEESAPLHKLGSDSWSRARTKAAEKVRDVAAELLDVYAQRAAKPGYRFALDREQYRAFSAGFPFEETVDQRNAINAVLGDMCQPQAMDRLVCGDVGFGKTEVAMRAAFVAVNDGKQVAVLVPTTLLAQQHFENFRDRFADWPVKVEVLSRFNTAKEQKAVLTQLQDGQVDIVIGTHKLLGSDIRFRDLGLLIVDEEHRFGVRQKEKIKALRADIDILTLTATPIPRTLNMAMSGMRDLSIIATPPARRLAIKTFVRQYDKPLVREAVMREILRGGQVYFLHNDVDTIANAAADLAQLVPEARIAIAHGQMRERELERIMSDFYHQRYNLLVCTTIIETGIDVPSANTIIMERADHLGLAQLHQLRGRVGRSHHQAYAYLLTPHPKRMTKDAVKRLEAIESLEDLGAGFTLATHDLEIRGAGELLGDEQSGQIASVGFSLYMEMLEQAVEALKQGKEPSLDHLLRSQTEIELRLPALLPEAYIPDVNLRLSMYKRLASCRQPAELDDIQVELIDRFGLLPDPAKTLIELTRLKIQAGPLGIRRLEAGEQGGLIEFDPTSKIDPGYLVGLLQRYPKVYRFDGPTRMRFNMDLVDRRDRLKQVETLLNEFAAHAA